MFKITCSEAYQYAPRGSVHPYALKIERLNGFTGPITLQLCERQVQDLDGIELVEAVVPEGATEAKAVPAAEALTDSPPVVPAKMSGRDLGPACEQCGGMMQRTGSCYTCSSCGNNTGCG